MSHTLTSQSPQLCTTWLAWMRMVGVGMMFFFLIPNQSKTVVSYNTTYPLGVSSGCNVLCPKYLHDSILFVFCLYLVATHLCES